MAIPSQKDYVIDLVGTLLSSSWNSDDQRSIEYFLEDVSEFDMLTEEDQHQVIFALIHMELELRRKAGHRPNQVEYRIRFPEVDQESIAEVISLPILPPT